MEYREINSLWRSIMEYRFKNYDDSMFRLRLEWNYKPIIGKVLKLKGDDFNERVEKYDENRFLEIVIRELNDNALVTVMDRFGIKVFETKSNTGAWDGYYKGEISPMETYIYIAEYSLRYGEKFVRRGLKQKGSVSLIK